MIINHRVINNHSVIMPIETKFIALPNGDIQFVKRGMPPQEVPGYTVDEGDPYLFHADYEPCAARGYKTLVMPCCPEGKPVLHCFKFGYFRMTARHCNHCVESGQSVDTQKHPNEYASLNDTSLQSLSISPSHHQPSESESRADSPDTLIHSPADTSPASHEDSGDRSYESPSP